MAGIVDDGAGFLSSGSFGILGVVAPKTARWAQLHHLENLREYDETWDWDVAPGALGVPMAEGLPVFVSESYLYLERELNGEVRDESSGTDVWFEDVHVLPREIDLGFVPQKVSTPIEIFNAYRRTDQTLNDWVNNDGPGIDVTGEPTLPHLYPAFTGSGTDVEIEVTTEGDPIVDTTLDFNWASVGTDVVTLEFFRITPLATETEGILIPEAKYIEELRFLTDIQEKIDGTEQRVSLRKNPRQAFEYFYRLMSEASRAELDMLLANAQARFFGAPVWYEQVPLTAALASGGTVLNVSTTAYSDFRVLGALAVYVEGGVWDMRGIESLTSTTITISTGVDNAYPAGAYVVPVRIARATARMDGARYARNVADVGLRFETNDNDIDIGSTAAFSTYDGKVFLDTYNAMKGTKPTGIERRLIIFDGEVGRIEVSSPWQMSKLSTEKIFVSQSMQATWEIRQLFHALHGSQTSFYVPSDSDDFTVTQSIPDDTDRVYVQTCGYTDNGFPVPRFDHIRITLADGTTYVREIIDAVKVIGVDEEQLTIDSALTTSPAGGVDFADIVRTEFVHLVRLASDTIRIQYEQGSRRVRVVAPIRMVLE